MNHKKIVITRPKLQSERLKRQLIDAGVDKNQLIISPVIEIEKVKNKPKIDNKSIRSRYSAVSLLGKLSLAV